MMDSDPEHSQADCSVSGHPDIADPAHDSDHSEPEVDSDPDHSQADSVSVQYDNADSAHDSDHFADHFDSEYYYSDDDSDSDSDPYGLNHTKPAARAAARVLVRHNAAAIQATNVLLKYRPQLLEELVLNCLDSADAAPTFIQQKRIFRMMPGRLLERINYELSGKWRRPPLVGLMMNPRISRLWLDLMKSSVSSGEDLEGWTVPELVLLFEQIAREGKTTLQELAIMSEEDPKGTHPGPAVVHLNSLLSELRALTSLSLNCVFQTAETDLLVSILTSTNPGIRKLRLPNLSNKSLCTIADRLPELEYLQADMHEFDHSHLKAVLPRLRNLKRLIIEIFTLCMALMSVARTHDPTTPPYILAEGIDCSAIIPLSSEDMVKLFTAFPALFWLHVSETEIQAVCAGLEGREHIHITELEAKINSRNINPRALEPLLALVGPHLTRLFVYCMGGIQASHVDINMIGNYCPKLQDLQIRAGLLVCGVQFDIRESRFSKLERLSLRQDAERDDHPCLHPVLLFNMFSSPTLKEVDAIWLNIPDMVAFDLSSERYQGALSSLEELTVAYPFRGGEHSLTRLVSIAPNLRFLEIVHKDAVDEALLEIVHVINSFRQQSQLEFRMHVRRL